MIAGNYAMVRVSRTISVMAFDMARETRTMAHTNHGAQKGNTNNGVKN